MCDDRALSEEIEDLIQLFGEEWRELITSSVTWMRGEEPKWNIGESLDGEGFVRELLSHVSKTNPHTN